MINSSQQDVLSRIIEMETFKPFQNRAMTLMKDLYQTYIDNVVDRMWNKVKLIRKREAAY